MSLEVYLVRHGKTVFNTTGRVQGWSDSPLMPEGVAVAEKLGRALAGKIDFDAAFSSTSLRAVDTAKLILASKGQNDLPLIQINELKEYCFGSFEGDLAENVHRMIAQTRGFADTKSWLKAYRHGAHNMLAESISELDSLGLAETEAQFVKRLKKGLKILIEQAPESGKVLLVSHGMSITGILKSIDPASSLYKSVKNATVSRLVFNGEGWKIMSIGEQINE
jgi:phosphoglycerate mutase family protein